ncbi:Uncharacterised protein [Actinomyces bovis]|uniref:PIN domain-containing protein n=1 Tax=Actinomyces bovis TaxID=1658 RepID=A0ABY1VP91_9ACTO|nr:hypothetical protein [Actinomyces bovis]SPT53262.1 Uncharacterised protein [Actinomyces bovis]VEG52539.1 Uncharacterised protein [Actinomyces israelii]
MTRVWFIDTSVLDHVLPVPGKSKTDSAAQKSVKLGLKERVENGNEMILPITAVVETGNHICQLSDGRLRRQAAERFAELLNMVIQQESPWVLDEAQWDERFLRQFLEGGSTGTTWVELATAGKSGLGGGDLTIVVERDQYCERTALAAEDVKIWTLDQGFQARIA